MKLTSRQLEVAACIGKGMTYLETAVALGISRDTVKAHVFTIVGKIPRVERRGLPQKAELRVWINEGAA